MGNEKVLNIKNLMIKKHEGNIMSFIINHIENKY